MTDEDFRSEFRRIECQLRALPTPQPDILTPNLDRVAALLRDLPALWQHPGVTPEQRRLAVGSVGAFCKASSTPLHRKGICARPGGTRGSSGRCRQHQSPLKSAHDRLGLPDDLLDYLRGAEFLLDQRSADAAGD